ncbi:hypothetical protein BJ508DRAFT_376405 [Ascobolus immersus RN42]|uniref:F-box domain-containing protein n=1 Tax=Ascobolus immersus RN42 TaxID=1160509 RepID=A0A3N4IBB5_ASCIM|nr:hypothetical protein BJ508DRAFT_376405 [Ascobolus immersus RN42]
MDGMILPRNPFRKSTPKFTSTADERASKFRSPRAVLHSLLREHQLNVWDFDGLKPITHRPLRIKTLPTEIWTEIFTHCRWDSLLALSETCSTFYSVLSGKETVNQKRSEVPKASARYAKRFWLTAIERDVQYHFVPGEGSVSWPELHGPFLDVVAARHYFKMISRADQKLKCENCPSMDGSPRWFLRKVLCYACISELTIDKEVFKTMLEKLVIEKNAHRISMEQEQELRNGWKYLPFDHLINTGPKSGTVYWRQAAGRFIKTLENALDLGQYEQWKAGFLQSLIDENPVCGVECVSSLSAIILMNTIAFNCKSVLEYDQRNTIQNRNRTNFWTWTKALSNPVPNLADTRIYKTFCEEGQKRLRELTFSTFVHAIPQLMQANDSQYVYRRLQQDRVSKASLFASVANGEFSWFLTQHPIYLPGLLSLIAASIIHHTIQRWHDAHRSCCSYHTVIGDHYLTLPDLISFTESLETTLVYHNRTFHSNDFAIEDGTYAKCFYCPFACAPTDPPLPNQPSDSLDSHIRPANCQGPKYRYTLTSLFRHILTHHPTSIYNPPQITPAYPVYPLLLPHDIRENRVRRWISKIGKEGVIDASLVHYIYPFSFQLPGLRSSNGRKYPKTLVEAKSRMGAYERGIRTKEGGGRRYGGYCTWEGTAVRDGRTKEITGWYEPLRALTSEERTWLKMNKFTEDATRKLELDAVRKCLGENSKCKHGRCNELRKVGKCKNGQYMDQVNRKRNRRRKWIQAKLDIVAGHITLSTTPETETIDVDMEDAPIDTKVEDELDRLTAALSGASLRSGWGGQTFITRYFRPISRLGKFCATSLRIDCAVQ